MGLRVFLIEIVRIDVIQRIKMVKYCFVLNTGIAVMDDC